jgi:hypothetical protein
LPSIWMLGPLFRFSDLSLGWAATGGGPRLTGMETHIENALDRINYRERLLKWNQVTTVRDHDLLAVRGKTS